MSSSHHVRERMMELGVDVVGPESPKEQLFADALEAFSTFVLHDAKDECISIIMNHLGDSVGELQGGSEEYEIYRILILDDSEADDPTKPALATKELLQLFYDSTEGKRFQTTLTVEKLLQYMLSMCGKQQSTMSGGDTPPAYSRLGNIMFILTFGATHGQVRHIDHMDPNVQICLYMSRNCPSTIVYSMEGPVITNVQELTDYWDANQPASVPPLVRDALLDHGDTPLKSMFPTKYFSIWESINTHLQYFGKLYQPVSESLQVIAEPGETLLAGGNQVHAGPPTTTPRMFAFAIGVPDKTKSTPSNKNGVEAGDEDNNGELQYNPALLQADLCCILFGLFDFEYGDRAEEHAQAKEFLLDILIASIKEYTNETYERLLGDDRSELREWLGTVVKALDDEDRVEELYQQALQSDTLFYTPEVQKKRSKKKKRRNNKAKS